MSIVIKRKGHVEEFDEKKVYGSVYAACASAHYDERLCERNAENVTAKVKKFVGKKKSLFSFKIREFIGKELRKTDEELAFYYEQHLPNLKRL